MSLLPFRRNTAATIPIGPILDEAGLPITDFAAPTALAISKAGSTSTVDMTAGGRSWSHWAGGIYHAGFLLGDLDTEPWFGYVIPAVAATNMEDWRFVEIVPEAYYDWKYSTGSLPKGVLTQADKELLIDTAFGQNLDLVRSRGNIVPVGESLYGFCWSGMNASRQGSPPEWVVKDAQDTTILTLDLGTVSDPEGITSISIA